MSNVKETAKKTVHATAVLGAATVAVLPIGLDAIALKSEEALMVLRIGSLFGVNLTKSAAAGLVAAAFAQQVGEAAALTALEASNATGPFAYAIKAGIATTLIESIGNISIDYFAIQHEISSAY